MLVINVFLCSAMTCSCTKHSKEEKEASYLEDFDPYARSWQGSQYGSRFKTSPSLIAKPTLKAPVLVFWWVPRYVVSTSTWQVQRWLSLPPTRRL